MIQKICSVFLLFIVVFTQAKSQQKPTPKLTPPKLQSFWGITKGGELPLEMVLTLIDSAVWVNDDKKVRYSVSRFILLFRSKDRFEDEESGEVKSRFNSSSVQIKNTSLLPENWRKNLYENLKKDDELLIADIIVRDKKGEYYKAPDIKIIVR
jgi:hypothetical protein